MRPAPSFDRVGITNLLFEGVLVLCRINLPAEKAKGAMPTWHHTPAKPRVPLRSLLSVALSCIRVKAKLYYREKIYIVNCFPARDTVVFSP